MRERFTRGGVQRRGLMLLMMAVSALGAGEAVVAQTAPGQPGQPRKPVNAEEAKKLVGTWTAKLKGKTFVILKLAMNEEQLVGTISTGEFGMDAEGVVTAVDEEATGDFRIYDVKITDGLLTFKYKDGEFVNGGAVKRINEKEAAMKLVIGEALPPGMQPPKPFRLVKEEAKP